MSFKNIGRIVKPFGLEGKLFIRLDEVDIEYFCSLKNVYWGPEQEPVSAGFLHYAKTRPDGKCVIQIDGVNSRTDAESLRGFHLFLPESEMPTLDKEDFQTDELEGYRIENPDGHLIGTVRSIDEYPAQIMITAVNNEQEFLIPLVEDFIVGWDHNRRCMILNLPEGLADED